MKKYEVKNVELNTKLLPKNELISYLNKADIFLLPMISGSIADQGLPTKIFEYQALRKPIICISSGELGKYILETKSGLVTNSRNPQELSQLILRLVNDDSLAKKLGENGYDNIKNNQTIEIIGKRLMSVIRKCV